MDDNKLKRIVIIITLTSTVITTLSSIIFTSISLIANFFILAVYSRYINTYTKTCHRLVIHSKLAACSFQLFFYLIKLIFYGKEFKSSFYWTYIQGAVFLSEIMFLVDLILVLVLTAVMMQSYKLKYDGLKDLFQVKYFEFSEVAKQNDLINSTER